MRNRNQSQAGSDRKKFTVTDVDGNFFQTQGSCRPVTELKMEDIENGR